MAVRVGLFLDLRNPPGWRRPWAAHYRQTLEFVEEADRLGIGSIWLSEHHFFEDGYMTQPFTMLSAIAARTSTARLGTAIVLAALRHPQHLAEEAILVDLVSGGRLEIGFGAGYRVPEYEAFGLDIGRRYHLTDAAMTEVRRLLSDGVVTPPPLQQPIPLWLGYQGPQGARRAGRLGVGLLSLDRRLLEPYQEGLVAAGLSPDEARMGGVIDILVADDPERAFETVLPFYAYQANTYRRYGAEGTGQAPPADLTIEKLRGRQKEPGQIPGLRVLTPDAAIAAIRAEIEGLPVKHVYCWGSIAGMPDDLSARHAELLATRVGPALSGGEATAPSRSQRS
jgi:alkanesulfonate monooxygenase SsuD/methylene tetrahydromethanopterin reductase-like flavin-dependent oxidoreductase (luciferase family)